MTQFEGIIIKPYLRLHDKTFVYTMRPGSGLKLLRHNSPCLLSKLCGHRLSAVTCYWLPKELGQGMRLNWNKFLIVGRQTASNVFSYWYKAIFIYKDYSP